MAQVHKENLPNAKLLEARLERHWSQRELAARLGTTFVNVSRWERGVTFPGAYYRQQLCQLFGKRPHELGLLSDQAGDERRTENKSPLAPTNIPLWSMPYQRNPFFTGRNDMLRRLHRLLTQKHTAVLSQSSTLSGLGGIGKTQVAIEYAYRYASDYEAIFWISAETAETIISSFTAMAELLNLPERQEHEQHRIVGAVSRWLQSHNQWLLIFDNVEEVEPVKSVLPPAHHGSLLFTSRRQALAISTHLLRLDTMPFEEGVQLFLRRTRLHDPVAAQNPPLPHDETAVQAIVAAMDGLPLAIDQAGSYIEATQCSPADYLQLLHTSPLQLLNEREMHADHPLSVTSTFKLALEQLGQSHPEAIEILTVCAYLGPEPIPEAFFQEGATQLGPTFEALAANPLRFHAAIKALLSYSLLQRDPTTHSVTVHRLLQAVLKESHPEATRRIWIGRVLQAMSHVFPSDEEIRVDYWQACEKLLPHALVCVRLWERREKNEAQLIHWVSSVAAYLAKRAQYTEAELLFRQALNAGEQVLGPEHPLVAYPLHGLTDIALKQGAHGETEPLFHKAVRLREQALGACHPLVARSLNNLAELYRRQGRYEQAEPLYLRALQILEHILGPEHPEVARSLNGLIILYWQRGQYEQAEPLSQRALRIWEQALGLEHPEVARSLNNLAIIYFDQHKYEQAEPLYQRALHIWERVLGPGHPDAAYPLNNLADFYRAQGKYEQAEPLNQRALQIREQALGPEHPDVAKSLNNLAELYYNQGKYEQAEVLYQRALRIWEQALGPAHPDSAYSLHGLANLYRDQGKYEQAVLLYQRVLQIQTQDLGALSLYTAEALHDFAMLQEVQGDREQARCLYERALRIYEQAFGSEHPKTKDTCQRLHALACTKDSI